MSVNFLHARCKFNLIRIAATTMLLALAACSQFDVKSKDAPEKSDPRAQLSIGYSLLYQEADGIPKLKWILSFKEKTTEMGQITQELVAYYQQLAGTMQTLSKQYPAMRIDVEAM